EIVDNGIVLAAQCDRTEPVIRHTDVRLTAEHAAALPQTAAIQVEAVFELKDRLVAAAQIFRAFQAPTAALRIAALQFDDAVAVDAIRIVDAFVDHAIQRDAALRENGSGEGGCSGQRDDLFLHWTISDFGRYVGGVCSGFNIFRSACLLFVQLFAVLFARTSG